MGLTRKQEEAHQRASDLIFGSDRSLKPDEVWFCLENWDPRAANLVSKTQAYFTPMALAMSATMNIAAPGRHILDLCAGTGRLSFALLQNCYWHPEVEITAVEINPDYVAVGRRLLPRVHWLEADVLDLALWQRLDTEHHFFCAVSNPPFGRAQTLADTTWLNLHGQKACFLIAEIGLRITQVGILALFPQSDVPFRFSGEPYARHLPPESYSRGLKRFKEIYPDVAWGCLSLDTSVFKQEWRGASPIVEIIDLAWEGTNSHPIPLTQKPTVVKPQLLSV